MYIFLLKLEETSSGVNNIRCKGHFAIKSDYDKYQHTVREIKLLSILNAFFFNMTYKRAIFENKITHFPPNIVTFMIVTIHFNIFL